MTTTGETNGRKIGPERITEPPSGYPPRFGFGQFGAEYKRTWWSRANGLGTVLGVPTCGGTRLTGTLCWQRPRPRFKPLRPCQLGWHPPTLTRKAHTMKKALLGAAMLVALAAPAHAAMNFTIPTNVPAGYMNVRNGPGTNHNLVGSIPAGAANVIGSRCVPRDDRIAGSDFCLVDWNNLHGWVASSGLMPTEVQVTQRWWYLTNSVGASVFNYYDPTMMCRTGQSPAQNFEYRRNMGQSPQITDNGDQVLVDYANIDPNVPFARLHATYFRTQASCEAEAQSRRTHAQEETVNLSQYR